VANTKGEIVDRVDKKAIGSAVDLMRMAAHYLELIVENDGLKRAKNHLIGENRKWREALGRKTSPPDPNTARPDDVVDLMILRKDYRKLHSENAKLKAELETVSKDRYLLQRENEDLQEQRLKVEATPLGKLNQRNDELGKENRELVRRLNNLVVRDHGLHESDDPDFEVADAPADKKRANPNG
jgi:hypothetical protein